MSRATLALAVLALAAAGTALCACGSVPVRVRPGPTLDAQAVAPHVCDQSYLMYLKRGSSGVPASALPSSAPGRHMITSSIFFASWKSRSVTPLAS